MVVHSLEQALYQVTVKVEGADALLVDDSDKPIRLRSLQAVREMLSVLPIGTVTLRHESPYDEMIGQPVRGQSNALEVPLSLDVYPAPTIH